MRRPPKWPRRSLAQPVASKCAVLFSQVTVVDDYAHHPTEISALLDAARRKYPQSAIRVIFQPHLFSRTKFFAEAFAEALAKADDVIVTGIFPAREKQEDYPTVGPDTIVDEALKLDHTPAEDWIRRGGRHAHRGADDGDACPSW